jgi:hypothetical protein
MEECMSDENDDLMETLLYTVGVIRIADSEDRMSIAEAYYDARQLAGSIKLENGSARSRIVACLERFDASKAAGDVAAAGWMLTALQLRIEERELRDWRKMRAMARRAARMLPEPALH